MAHNAVPEVSPLLSPSPAPPRLIFWETTAGCNLRCVHCRRLDVLDQVSDTDLSTDAAQAMIADIAQNFKPILVLSGGEPLVRPDILELASFARDRGLRVALATNGTLVTAEKAKGIREAGVARVSISLDGVCAATHDRFRGAGNFDRALAGFDHLKREGVSLQINMTVTRFNAEELPQLYEMVLARGASALHLFMLVPVGCGVQIAETDMLPSEEYEKWLNWFYERDIERKIELKATCAPHYFRIVRQRSKEIGGLPPSHHRQEAKGATHPNQSLHQTTKGCLAGQGVCFVSHTGEVFPCGYLPLSVGNIRATPFKTLWDTSPVFEKLRNPDKLEGKCGACSFKYVCGGCRARAYYAHGDEQAEEPHCIYVPPGFNVSSSCDAL
ncbi:MAG: radical SAM protein [Elusimicrobia bacterium]|nr:radical SAM protein [Elusimicrobiota bacterium]